MVGKGLCVHETEGREGIMIETLVKQEIVTNQEEIGEGHGQNGRQ